MKHATLAGCGEAQLIDQIRRQFVNVSSAAAPVCMGIGDDAALIVPAPEQAWVLTTDSAVEGEDFDFSCFPPDAIGYRAAAQNLSDLAAMGARPRGMLLNLVAAQQTPRGRFEKILQGLAQAADEAGCPLIGGDLSTTQGPMVLAITMTGEVPRGQALLRSTARPGDQLWVSGSVGAAAQGLKALLARSRAPVDSVAAWSRLSGPRRLHYQKFLHPTARLDLGQALRQIASACIDISDGLLQDAQRLAQASGVAIEIQSAALPRDPGVGLAQALFGGEDFELLWTADPKQRKRLQGLEKKLHLGLHQIGQVVAGRGLRVDGKIWNGAGGFDHFMPA